MTIGKGIVLLALAAVAAPALAGDVELSFNNESAQAKALFDLAGDQENYVRLGGRGLWNNDADAALGSAVLLFGARPEALPDVEIALGGQATFGEVDPSFSIGSFAVGVQATWAPGPARGAFVGAHLFYGPSIFSWGDTDSMFEWGVRGGYRFTPKLGLFLEYQQISLDSDSGPDADVDEDLRFGFFARF